MLEDGASQVLGVVASGGQPLPGGIRDEMEGRLGEDFSDVRIHTGDAAHESAQAVGSRAYTVGSHIAFTEGAFDPSSHTGKTTLAHELTHVVQQRYGQVDGRPAGGSMTVSDPGDRFERAAAATAEDAMRHPLGYGVSDRGLDGGSAGGEPLAFTTSAVQRDGDGPATDPDDGAINPDDDPFMNPPAIKPADDSIGQLVEQLRAQEDQDAPAPLPRPAASLDAGAENLKQMSLFAQRTLVHYGSKYGAGEPSEGSKTGMWDSIKQEAKDFLFGGPTTRAIAKAASDNQKTVDNATVVASLLRSSFAGWLTTVDASNSAWGLTRMQAKECQIDIAPGELPKDDPRRLAGLGGEGSPQGPSQIDLNQVAQGAQQVGADAKATGSKQGIDNTSFLAAQRNHAQKTGEARIAQRAAATILFESSSKANGEMVKAEEGKKEDWQAYKKALDTAITAVEFGVAQGGGVALPEGHGGSPLPDPFAAPPTSASSPDWLLPQSGELDKKKLADWGIGALKAPLDEKIAKIEQEIKTLKECQSNRQAVISAQQDIAKVEAYHAALAAERDAIITLDEEGQKMQAALQEFGGTLDQSVEDKGLMPKGFSANEADMILLGRIRQALGTTQLAMATSVSDYVAELKQHLTALGAMTDGPWPALVATENTRCAQIAAVVAEAQRLLNTRMQQLAALQRTFVAGMNGAGQVNKPY